MNTDSVAPAPSSRVRAVALQRGQPVGPDTSPPAWVKWRRPKKQRSSDNCCLRLYEDVHYLAYIVAGKCDKFLQKDIIHTCPQGTQRCRTKAIQASGNVSFVWNHSSSAPFAGGFQWWKRYAFLSFFYVKTPLSYLDGGNRVDFPLSSSAA